MGVGDRHADRPGAGDPAPAHLQVVEVDDPAAAARAADEDAADEVQGRPAAHAAGDDEVLSGEPGQPVRVLPPDGRPAAGLPRALLHAARRPAVRHLPGHQPAGHGEPAAVRGDARVELPLHPGPDEQGDRRSARRADRALRRVAARLDAAHVRHRGQEPAEDLPGAAVPVRRLHLAVPGRPARLLDHDEPVDDPAAVDHQEAPRPAPRGSHGCREGGQGRAGADEDQGQERQERRQEREERQARATARAAEAARSASSRRRLRPPTAAGRSSSTNGPPPAPPRKKKKRSGRRR